MKQAAASPYADASEAASALATTSPAPSEAPSSTSTTTISPHYDDKRDIICRQEFLSDRALKTIILAVEAATAVGVAFLIAWLVLKLSKPDDYMFQNNSLFITNTVVASIQVISLLLFLSYYIRRIVRSTLSGKRWSTRRLKGVTISITEQILQLANSCLFLAVNANVLAKECSWFSPLTAWDGFARWTIWNTLFLIFIIQASNTLPICGPGSKRLKQRIGRPDAIMMDAPMWVHWPKLSIWCAFEGTLMALTIELLRNPKPQPAPLPWQSCRDISYDCTFTTANLVLVNFSAFFPLLYLLVYLSYIRRTFRMLYARPYNQYRMGNQIVRMQIRLRGVAFSFFIICIVIFTYVNFNTCSAFLLSWFGFTPMQIVATVVAIAHGYLTVPCRPGERGILQVWLQEFAWTERDIPRKRSERSSSLPEDSFEGFCMDCEPLFCFETAIKMMYWSYLVYEHKEQNDSPFTPEAAMSLYNLDHFEMVWEQAMDSKALLGWNENTNTVVISFRGTASMTNVLADLQVWRSRHPPGVGSPLLWSAPMAHQGFLSAYTKNGFNDRLLGMVEHILNRCFTVKAGASAGVQVYVTGHSLGGALAVLCAYDIAERSAAAGLQTSVKCYTFGAPRVGNHAWARLYNERVPETWQMINADDAVTRAGKFFFLYKHVGNRVLMNRRGDLIVRPSYVEYALRRVPGGSVQQHYLTQYQQATVAVVAAQFGSKSLGGADGIQMLAEDDASRKALSSAGLTSEQMKKLESMSFDGAVALEEGLTKSGGSGSVGPLKDADNPSGLSAPSGRGIRHLLAQIRSGGRRMKEPVSLQGVIVAGRDPAISADERETASAGSAAAASAGVGEDGQAGEPSADAEAQRQCAADSLLQCHGLMCRWSKTKRRASTSPELPASRNASTAGAVAEEPRREEEELEAEEAKHGGGAEVAGVAPASGPEPGPFWESHAVRTAHEAVHF